MLDNLTDHVERYIRSVDVRKLGRRYLCAVLIILAAVSTSHTAAFVTVNNAANDAEIVNMSGRQRMLSQRILNFANQAAAGAHETALFRLIESIDEFERAHRYLSASNKNNADLRKIYFEEADSIDELATLFIKNARVVAAAHSFNAEARAALERVNAIGSDLLLSKLNRAVYKYEQVAKNNITILQYIKFGSLIVTVLVLALEALFIFWPAHIAAARAIRDRERRLKLVRHTAATSVGELQRLRVKAEHDALHDALTGLPNRRYLERFFDEIRRKNGEQLVVLHVGLDHFKQINEAVGHAAGDYVLQHVAEILRNETRDQDFVARICGDEFIIVLRSVPKRRFAEKLAARIMNSASQPIRYEGDYCVFGVSVGVDFPSSKGDAPPDPSIMLQNADIALCRAKELGRGRCVFYEPEMREKLYQRKSLSDDMMLGLPRGEFVPYYQPQFDAATGC